MDPSGNYLLFCSEIKGIHVEQIESDGTLTPVSGSPFLHKAEPSATVFAPTGQFLYVCGNTETLYGFSFGSDGSLTLLPNFPLAATGIPSLPTVDQNGKFLFTVVNSENGLDASLAVYQIGSGGGLTEANGSPYPIRSYYGLNTLVVADPP